MWGEEISGYIKSPSHYECLNVLSEVAILPNPGAVARTRGAELGARARSQGLPCLGVHVLAHTTWRKNAQDLCSGCDKKSSKGGFPLVQKLVCHGWASSSSAEPIAFPSLAQLTHATQLGRWVTSARTLRKASRSVVASLGA